MQIRAISLDLDDTLWPIGPVLERVEREVDVWLRENCPEVAAAWPIESLRALREEVASEHPEIAHDFAAQRRLTLQRAFAPFKLGEDWIDRTYEVYVRARNKVECYADTTAALTRMAVRFPLISISNGTAELHRIGLHEHFRFSISAGEVGVAKPDADIFRHACARLGIAAQHVLHVGDDPFADVLGAHAAGMRTVWLNRHGARWQQPISPDLEVADLTALATWAEQHPHAEHPLPA